MKITMLGGSRSGKTSYMAGLYERLCITDIDGFQIFPAELDIRDAAITHGRWEEIGFVKNDYTFPKPTELDVPMSWTFNLLYGIDRVCAFDWIDYRGGDLSDIFRNKPSTDKEQLEQKESLLSHLILSDAVIVFADSIMLTQYPDATRRIAFTRASYINQLLFNLNELHPDKELVVVLALCKADSDLITDDWRQNEFAKLHEIGRNTFRKICQVCEMNPRWTFGSVPVGVAGTKNIKTETQPAPSLGVPLLVKTTLTPPLEPMNVEHPLFYCLCQLLHRQQRTAHDLKLQLQGQINRERERLDANAFIRFLRRIAGQEDPNAIIDKLSNARLHEEAEIRKYANAIAPLCKRASAKVQTL